MGVRQQLLGVLVALLASGCATAHGGSSGEEAVVISERDDGRQVGLRVGQRLVLELPTQLGTGFDWRAEAVPDAILRLVDDEVLQNQPTSRVGREEVHRFVFEAVGAGEGALRLSYLRAWEGEASTTRRYAVAVVVE